MEVENNHELLCVKGVQKSYAFEFPLVRELCPELKISRVPCLPPFFAGVCNYKGNIVPVLTQEHGETREGRLVILIFSCQEYLVGMMLHGEPTILNEEACQVITKPETAGVEGIWQEKALLQDGDDIVTVLDMEKIILNLARYFQEEYQGC